MKVFLKTIRIDGGTQPRAHLDQAVVADYAALVKAGGRKKLPPVIVFFDGSEYWLADGFHRYHAHKKAGKESIDIEIKNGTQRDAVLFSCGANAEHGLRRSNEDKRRAVDTLLADPEWGKWSDRKVADQAGVSHTFVANIRSEVATVATLPDTSYATEGVATKRETAVSTPAKSGKKPEQSAQQKADAKAVEDGMNAVSVEDQLARALAQVSELTVRIEAMAKDDTAAELNRQVAIRQGIEVQLNREMTKNANLNKELRHFGAFIEALRKVTGMKSEREILAVCRERFARAA